MRRGRGQEGTQLSMGKPVLWTHSVPLWNKEEPVIIYHLQVFDTRTLLIVKFGASGFALNNVPVVFVGVMVSRGLQWLLS